MKADKNQMSFDEKLARPIKPDADISEPFLWFQNLHLVKRLGVGDTEENHIRSFTLRRGLNILWAEPEDPETSEGLYGDGFAGHATGKTLFCRILRHLLGEPNYGTEELEKHVKDAFQELWAVATIRLNGKTWLVGRPLAGPGGDFAIEDGKVESVFAAVPTFSGYRKFTEALENGCGKPLAKMYPDEAWRNLLPSIARDQEARFSTITAWRDSSSEADNPRTSKEAQHLILRAVLGLLHPDEFDMRAEVTKKEDEIKGWNGSVPIKQTVASRDLGAVRKTLDAVPRLAVDLVDLEAAKNKVTSQKEIRQEALEHFQKQPESDEVVAARKALQDAVTAQATANARIKTLTDEIPAVKQQAEKSLLLVDDIKKKGLRDPKRVADKFCPNSYLKAVERECVEASPKDVEASMVEISELEEQAKSLADSVQAKQDEKARLESRTDQLAAAIIQKNIDLSAAIKRFPSPALAIEREITLLEKAEEELDTAMESAKALDELNMGILRAQNQIFTLKEKLSHLKSEADKKLRSFSEIFADISRAVLGGSISASADLTAGGIQMHVRRSSRDLGGAAVESVKTIAFDLAAVLHAIEGNCTHPRFLIHDGPREADMARVIYERFFLYARRIEDCQPPEESTFQYILTTTTHPPSDMQESSKWLLGEKLSGKTKAGRLLMEDF
jgi:hypothetical protein